MQKVCDTLDSTPNGGNGLQHWSSSNRIKSLPLDHSPILLRMGETAEATFHPHLNACLHTDIPYNDGMKVELDIPESTFSALRQAPAELAACIRLMAAAKLYETGHLSQERAAELAGLARQDFLLRLARLGVSPFQGVEDDLALVSTIP